MNQKNKDYVRLFYVFILLLLLFYFSSCTNNIFIPGTYIANDKIGADTLKILSNHKFIRICYSHTSENTLRYVDTGTWNTDGIIKREIVFRDWYDRNGMNHSGLDSKFIYIAYIDRKFYIGKLRILINDDLDYYYIKE